MNPNNNKHGPDLDTSLLALRQARDGTGRMPRDGTDRMPRDGIAIISTFKRRAYSLGKPVFGTGNGRGMPGREMKSQNAKCKSQMANGKMKSQNAKCKSQMAK